MPEGNDVSGSSGKQMVQNRIILLVHPGEMPAFPESGGAGRTHLISLITGAEQADSGNMQI